jgi:hypothetical protein
MTDQQREYFAAFPDQTGWPDGARLMWFFLQMQRARRGATCRKNLATGMRAIGDFDAALMAASWMDRGYSSQIIPDCLPAQANPKPEPLRSASSSFGWRSSSFFPD